MTRPRRAETLPIRRESLRTNEEDASRRQLAISRSTLDRLIKNKEKFFALPLTFRFDFDACKLRGKSALGLP